MKVNFKFSNLIGTVYRKGNLVFSSDGNTILSPVGNKVTIYDLKNHRSETLNLESRTDIITTALSPTGTAAIFFSSCGDGIFFDLVCRRPIHTHFFKFVVKCAQFSPDGRYFVACRATDVQLFRAPSVQRMQYNPFYLERKYLVSHDQIKCVSWSSDSKYFVIGSDDAQLHVCSVERYQNFVSCKLGGHRDTVVACFFIDPKNDLYSVDSFGKVCVWENMIDETLFVPGDMPEESIPSTSTYEKRLLETADMRPATSMPVMFNKTKTFTYRDNLKDSKAKLNSADYNGNLKIIASGFSDGSFFLHEMPDFTLIHSLNISQQAIHTVTINPSGDWIGLGCKGLGQLIVWEWQSETYIMKQQGHYYDMSCIGYSPDGHYIATGGQDGKIKLWTPNSGFCFVTFGEHTSNITGLAWTQSGRAIVSSSLDGSVRAFDMKRYRNFRTFVAEESVQFSGVCVNNGGDVVCASAQDAFNVYVWAMQTGQLLEVLSGHQGPVSSIAIANRHDILATCSWDKTLKIWDIFEAKGNKDSISVIHDGLCVQFSPDGNMLACLTMESQIMLFDWAGGAQLGTIDCKLDVDPGRGDHDLITSKSSRVSKHFTCMCFSADGEYIIAGGQSRFICLYSVKEQILLKKFFVTANESLDNMADDFSRRNITKFGNLSLAKLSDDEDEARSKNDIPLPGVRRPDKGERKMKVEFRVNALHFSPTGRSFAACTTDGLMMYSLDNSLIFNPFELEQDVSPAAVHRALLNEEHGDAISMAIKLNDWKIIQEALERTPRAIINLICRAMPLVYVEKLLNYIVIGLERSRHVEFYIYWAHQLLLHHGNEIKARSRENMALLTAIQQTLVKKSQDISKICDYSNYGVEYIIALQKSKARKREVKVENDSDGDDDDDDMLMQPFDESEEK